MVEGNEQKKRQRTHETPKQQIWEPNDTSKHTTATRETYNKKTGKKLKRTQRHRTNTQQRTKEKEQQNKQTKTNTNGNN